MNNKRLIVQTVVIFIALAFAGIGMALSAKLVSDALEQMILVAVGSALFGASLTFFLVRILSIEEK
ncbi:MAG TPA: hypothetical protein VK900_13460 [Anaerolineales bacterium]|nr:hypothetical protein [Anaerolineales bacterium]